MTTHINPLHLWPYREYDRNKVPAPKCFGSMTYSVKDVAKYIKGKTIEPVEVSIIDNRLILVTDGNHRLAASIKNKAKSIPFVVKHYTKKEALATFHEFTLKRFVQL